MHEFIIAAALLAAPALAIGCASAHDVGESAEDGDHEAAPVAASEGALISTVDCTERTETAYDQGKPYSIQVITIGGKAVAKATGHQFLKMQKAANDAGVALSLTSGFRTMAEQQYLYDCYLTKSCNNGNLAAKPGYSNHQNGRAVDVSTSSWLFANAAKFGFVRTVPSEDWHWEYAGPDTGGPCSTSIEWVSPKDGGHYTNGIWFKARSSNAAVTKIAYWADKWKLGESSDKASDYPVRYTFGTLGDRSVTAKAYDASGTEISSSTISIKIFP